ncbi:hypothetical protein [Radiobacillus deserti]|uniref:Uncharacterized protein n=1 Tax=Radiobacillus deserti TaxID=2594883 RepID=A0A516KJY3_9BACI|nr:hypothetical protein [Radiobacillus deserti]QDP41698.1 hypothetical protein FN924_16860 [Radiobacillus deserti]
MKRITSSIWEPQKKTSVLCPSICDLAIGSWLLSISSLCGYLSFMSFLSPKAIPGFILAAIFYPVIFQFIQSQKRQSNDTAVQEIRLIIFS